jgi:Na+-transporting NADH:ubiquinone oxidoreductase subunit NqrB
VAATFAAAFGTELLLRRFRPTRGATAFDPRSPLITCLSLCLLLRTASVPVAALAGAVAIASKSLVRVGGRHVFNPANLGLVLAMALFPTAWASSGQWGTETLAAFALASLGTVVTTRAARADVTFGFLGFYAGLLCLRALWLGDPLAIPLHRLQSGALLLFAFFMISDPRTTPSRRSGRLLFAALVALAAVAIDFELYWNNGPLWALALAAPLVPLIDRLLPAGDYLWPGRRRPPALRGPWAAAGPMAVRLRSGLAARSFLADNTSLAVPGSPDEGMTS